MAHTEHDSDPQTSTSTGERLRVARIGKPHGTRGEVTAQLFTDEPAERLGPGALLVREPGRDTQDTIAEETPAEEAEVADESAEAPAEEKSEA